MKYYRKRVFNFVWLKKPNKGLTVTVYAYDLKQARKIMLSHVKSQFNWNLGQNSDQNRRGYFKFLRRDNMPYRFSLYKASGKIR